MDTIDPARRSENMRRIRSADTSPEMAVRRLVHRMGYRYRLHRTDLPGKPDLVFPSRKKVIFVHGCFWHRHPACGLARLPKSRLSFWVPKLEGNRRRDLKNIRGLKKLGWAAEVIWECETKNLRELARKVHRFLKRK